MDGSAIAVVGVLILMWILATALDDTLDDLTECQQIWGESVNE